MEQSSYNLRPNAIKNDELQVIMRRTQLREEISICHQWIERENASGKSSIITVHV